MSRKEYLRRQKNLGRSLIGVFPAQYPREILWAMNFLPVEIWDPPVSPVDVAAHLQPSICSVARSGLELILQGKTDMLDGFLFPHTCDSIQNLASVVNDCLNVETPCFFFYHPKAPYSRGVRRYYEDRLRGLSKDLARLSGPLKERRLMEAVNQGLRLYDLLNQAYDLRRNGGLSVSSQAFYRHTRLVEYMHPEDFISSLETFLAESKGESLKGPAILLTGILPEAEILRTLDGLGVRVVDDDLLSGSRRFPHQTTHLEDPYQTLVKNYLAMPPCPTRGSPIQDRIDFLVQKVKDSGARGVIFCGVKFCEPEWFDVPQLMAALKNADVKTLAVDVEVHQGMSGPLSTRIEAFVEMLG